VIIKFHSWKYVLIDCDRGTLPKQEPCSEDLARHCFVNHGALVTHWLANARRIVAEAQELYNEDMQLGGAGIAVEMDEVCFRARWAYSGGEEDGTWGKEWIRYIAAFERRSGRLILKQLPSKFASGGGQGGGGGLTAEELHDFIFRASGVPLLHAGTIVHSDGAPDLMC
jgi:hypothetical protein